MEKVIIIGSGISGLIFARELNKVGINPLIIDKGFTLGGRIASRPFNGDFFDHGAQYFTSKSDYFENLVQELLDNNIIKILDEENGKKKYIGINGMNNITQYLSKKFNIRQSECVNKISFDNDKWILETDKNNKFETANLILSAPVPQSILLSESGNFKIPLDLKNELEKVKYSRCIALIGKFKNSLLISKFDNHKSYKKIDNDNVISWVSDNNKKGITDKENSFTIHLTPDYSEENWDNINKEYLTRYIEEYFDNEIEYLEIKKWKFAQTLINYPKTYEVISNNPMMIFIGDGFGKPRIESAVISSLDAFKYFYSTL